MFKEKRMSQSTVEQTPQPFKDDEFDKIIADNFSVPTPMTGPELHTVSVATIVPAFETLTIDERLNLLRPIDSLESYTPLRFTGDAVNSNKIYELDDASYSSIGSFKYRGAWNAIASLPYEHLLKYGVVTASAGNHAQGVAYSVRRLNEIFTSRPYLNVGNKRVVADIYVPLTIAPCKLRAIKEIGGDDVNVIVKGNTFDDSNKEAQLDMANKPKEMFIEPFDQEEVIDGQSTEAKALIEKLNAQNIPLNKVRVFVTVGGGGLASGYIKEFLKLPVNKRPKLVGVQLEGADSAYKSYWHYKKTGELEVLPVEGEVNKLADGAGVRCVGSKTLKYLTELDDFVLVSNLQVGKHYVKEVDSRSKVAEVYHSSGADPFYGLPEPASMLSRVGCYEYANLTSNMTNDRICPEDEVWVYINTGINYNPDLVNEYMSIYQSSLPVRIGRQALRMANNK